MNFTAVLWNVSLQQRQSYLQLEKTRVPQVLVSYKDILMDADKKRYM